MFSLILLRVGGRLQHGSLAYDVKHPVIMPETHDVTSLIIQPFHEKIHHQGRGITAGEIRGNGFWVIKLTKIVKKLIRTCITCRKLRSNPCAQKMSDLPSDRLSQSPPFLECAADCFRPFVVKSGRRELKRYGILFTCLNCRAVHLEVLYTLGTDSFLNSFKRLVALRGPVKLLRCDQGTNFVGARADLLKFGCEMVCNPPAASHRGGVWERMIGVARRVIEGILIEQGSQLNDESLLTVLAETAAVINSRPLAVQNLDDPLSQEPLTPNHLLTMKSKVFTHPVQSSNREDLYALRQWRRA